MSDGNPAETTPGATDLSKQMPLLQDNSVQPEEIKPPMPPSSPLDSAHVQALLSAARATASGAGISLEPAWFVAPKPAIRPVRSVRAPARLLIVALGLGGMVDALFYGQQPGIGLLVFVLLALVAVTGLAWNEDVRVDRRNVPVLATPLLFFSIMVSVRDNGFLVFLDICAVLYLAGLLVRLYVGGTLFTRNLPGFMGAPWQSVGHALIDAVSPLLAVARAQVGESQSRKRTAAVIRGLLLAVPLLVILVPLLLSADAVFAREANQLFAWLFPKDWEERFWRGVLILCCGWLAAGALVYALTRPADMPASSPKEPVRPFGFIEGMTPLALVAVLFAAFVTVQFAYLFGGDARVQAIPGLTYSAYARQGFGELVVVALLTLGIVTLWQRLMRREAAGKEIAFRSIATLLVAMTLVMLASAYQRMAVYEAAYGASDMRLYVDVFIVCLGLTFAWFTLTLWSGLQRYFTFGALVCGMGYVAALNLLVPDAVVARTNVERARTGQHRLDQGTLAQLSDDAIPVLCDAFERMPASADRAAIAKTLQERLELRKQERTHYGWPSWNASRERAYRCLQGQADALAIAAAAAVVQTTGKGGC